MEPSAWSSNHSSAQTRSNRQRHLHVTKAVLMVDTHICLYTNICCEEHCEEEKKTETKWKWTHVMWWAVICQTWMRSGAEVLIGFKHHYIDNKHWDIFRKRPVTATQPETNICVTQNLHWQLVSELVMCDMCMLTFHGSSFKNTSRRMTPRKRERLVWYLTY